MMTLPPSPKTTWMTRFHALPYASLLGFCIVVLPFSHHAETRAEPRPGTSVIEESQSLSSLVKVYLTTADNEEARRVLDQILRDPQATVQHIEAILGAGPSYQAQPVGMLPGQPVRVRSHTLTYGLWVPSSYNSAKEYPLVVCLHGAGFSGNAYLERWQPRLGEDYILACPTLMQGTWWTRGAEELVLATLQTVKARYHIDADRIFLTGMSNGGIGAWIIGFHHAPLFAGLAPMASGIDTVLFPFLENLRNTPVYMIHGRHDHVMPIRLSRSIAQTLSQLGYPFTFREHDRTHPVAGGHFFPRQELPDLIVWLNTQRLNPAPRKITLVRDATHLTAFGWVRIDATDRIAAFTENLIDSRDERIINREYAKLEATIVAPNRIEVSSERVRRFTLFLNTRLVDLSHPLTVVTNGRVGFKGMVSQNPATLLREARLRQDWNALFPAQLSLPVETGP